MVQLISIMQEQLALQHQQLAEQRQQAKEQLEQSRAQVKTLLLEQHRQVEAWEKKLIQVLTKGVTTTKGAHLFVASWSIPKFVPFDASVELWKDYLTRFIALVGANSIPDENLKIAQVFLINQSTTNYKMLCTVVGQ